MDEVGEAPSTPQRAGDVLRAARERQGLSLAEIAQRTRVPLRHLEAIEASDHAGLPSPTYATGFAKAYARAVGEDEVAIARRVREEIDRVGYRQPEYQPYEAADPARVPSRGLTAVALGLALAIAVLAGLWYGTDLFRGGGGTAPAASVAVPEAMPSAAPTAAAAAPTGGQVVLTATGEVWMRVYDAANKTLYLGTMQPGERFEVPADADGPMINVGRPDQLTVTLNGSAVAPLGDGSRAIKDVAIGGAAIAARAAGQPVPTPSATPLATAPTRTTRVDRARRERPAARPTPALSETQRANLSAAGNPPAAAPAPAATPVP